MRQIGFRLAPLLICLLLFGCQFKVKDGLNWDQNLVAPIIKSRVGLAELLKDTSLVKTDPDNFITVVYRDTLIDLSLSDYLVVPDTSYAAKITLNSITLATDTLVQDITMQQITDELCLQGQTIFCNLQPGSFIPFVPPFTFNSTTDQTIDASQFFEEADLIAGEMVVQIENHLPINISEVIYHLRNNGQYHDTLVKDTVGPIAPGQMVESVSDLSGKTVESQMAARLERITSPGGPGFTYDPNDYLRVRIIVRGLRASRATAVFPAQRVIDDKSRINYIFDNGVEITKIKSKTGHLRLDAYSTLQDTIAFTYALPTAIKNGQAVLVQDRLVPGGNGAEAHIDLELVDYYIDMTLNGDSVNLFPYHLTGDLLYSGNLNTMDLTDSIDLTYGLEGIVPSYIEGYLGQSTVEFADSLKLAFFNNIIGGDLFLQNPKVKLTIQNSIGVDGQLTVRQLQAINHRKGQSLSLTGALMNSPTEIRGPRLPNVGQTVTTEVELKPSNSNIRDFLGVLPDELRFDMEVLVNQNGNPELHDNFATDESRLAAFLDIEVPLHLQASQLIIVDTLDMDLSDATLPKGVESGQLKLVLENGFPIRGYAQVLFVDHTGAVFDSLFNQLGNGHYFQGGHVDANGIVDEPGSSVLVAQLDQAKFTRLKQMGAKAIVRFNLTTFPFNQSLKLYSTYGIDFRLVGDFIYHVGS
ncbi:MAG: hypothetical protein U0176_14365 [Bacteroidia bacterium]